MLTLSDKAFVYLVKVRRMREGDILSALLPQSGAADMVIDSINTVKKTLRVKRQTAHAMLAPLPAAELILLQWVLKGSKTDTIIRQATEAGVRAVLPVIGEFSVAKKQNPRSWNGSGESSKRRGSNPVLRSIPSLWNRLRLRKRSIP